MIKTSHDYLFSCVEKNITRLQRYSLIFALLAGLGLPALSQGDTDYAGGLTVPLNDDGSKYFRILGWGQIWAKYSETENTDVSHYSISIRRARGLFYSQLNSRFMFLAHIGINSVSSASLNPTGKDDGSQIFLHGLWGEYTVLPSKLYVGAGLHYWNGISRLNSQSTLNMLTLDNHRSAWSTLGLSDQYGRHLGIYAKGTLGSLSYRISINDAIRQTLDSEIPVSSTHSVYRGKELLGKTANFTFSGYFEINLLDKESSFLPYKVGTYLGSKNILTIGAGFFRHPNGTVLMPKEGDIPGGQSVNHLGFDVFYDVPLNSEKGSALTAYFSYLNLDYGKNYFLNAYVATGHVLYGHIGYLLPWFSTAGKLQPYLSYSWKSFDAVEEYINHIGVGMNWFIQGHHAKISLEYGHDSYAPKGANQNVILQAMVFL